MCICVVEWARKIFFVCDVNESVFPKYRMQIKNHVHFTNFIFIGKYDRFDPLATPHDAQVFTTNVSNSLTTFIVNSLSKIKNPHDFSTISMLWSFIKIHQNRKNFQNRDKCPFWYISPYIFLKRTLTWLSVNSINRYKRT